MQIVKPDFQKAPVKQIFQVHLCLSRLKTTKHPKQQQQESHYWPWSYKCPAENQRRVTSRWWCSHRWMYTFRMQYALQGSSTIPKKMNMLKCVTKFRRIHVAKYVRGKKKITVLLQSLARRWWQRLTSLKANLAFLASEYKGKLFRVLPAWFTSQYLPRESFMFVNLCMHMYYT